MTSLSPGDPNFFPKIRNLVGKSSLINETYEKMEASGLQEGGSYLALKNAREWASLLVDERGIVELEKLPLIIKDFEAILYPIGLEMGIEKRLFQLRALKKLLSTPELLRILGTIDVPYREPLGEKWIRTSLGLKQKDPIQKKEAVIAVLSAWLTPLRQNVGSCFATAPAIQIQEEHPEWLLNDLKDLLETGRMKRVIQGVEHQAPLVNTMGFGSLKANLPFDAIKWADAPGLKKSFDAMGIPLSLITKLFSKGQPPFFSADELLSLALKTALGINDRDIKEFLGRKRSEPFPSLLVRPGDGGQGKKVTEYLEKLEAGRLAYVLMTEHPLLKAWEYTLASFAETKGDFASWNLYASLGFEREGHGGIGEIIFQSIQHGLDVSNRKLHELQEEYQAAYLQIVGVESRLKTATTEKELLWIRADYQSKKNELNTIELLRDRERNKGERLANLPNQLVNHFIELFPKYFQEVYDPDLQEVKVGPFDDAPAGFRLLFKHGRASISAWTPIKTPEEFIDNLVGFFQSTEREFEEEQIKGIEREVAEVITAICLHLRTREFITTAFDRMARAHHLRPIQDPLENLDKIEKKPWAFTSGGTMKGLVTAYFSLEEPPKEVERWVENREELLVFLVDEIKKLPPTSQKSFEESSEKGILMHSPTHAFRLLPALHPFFEATKKDVFTYTWVRDELVEPQKTFYRNLTLTTPAFDKAKEAVSALLPIQFRETFKAHLLAPSPWISIPHFRELVYEAMKHFPTAYSYFSLDELESLLFEVLPFTPFHRLDELAKEFLETLGISKFSSSVNFQELLSRKELRHSLIASAAISLRRDAFSFDIEAKAIEFLRKKELEPPPSILFADTNWEGAFFGFQASPGTLDLDLWRFNRLATKGTPMSAWQRYLDGSTRSPAWGLYPTLAEFL